MQIELGIVCLFKRWYNLVDGRKFEKGIIARILFVDSCPTSVQTNSNELVRRPPIPIAEKYAKMNICIWICTCDAESEEWDILQSH